MFKKLKGEMFANDIDQKYLCKELGKSKTYMTNRMTGRYPWCMDDVYKICDLLEITYDRISEYFPKDGKDIKKVTNINNID